MYSTPPFQWFVHEEHPKTYLKVRVDHLPSGRIVPLMFRTEDGERMVIDQIVDVRRAAAFKAGGNGVRYTCRVGERLIFLFRDSVGWFWEDA